MNEDTSYVSLSLEKYNELYDKAKKYDEMKFEEVKKEIDSYYDVEAIKDLDCIPKGAKGKLLELNSDFPYVDWDKFYKTNKNSCYGETFKGIEYKNVYAVNMKYLKKLNEGEEKIIWH